MINIEDLNTWDVYVMVMNAKPLSASKLKATKEFNKKFDDLRFNDAVEENWLEDWEIPFVGKFDCNVYKYEYVGTGDYGDEISILNDADYVKKGKRVKGSICYGASCDGDMVDENIAEYMSFDDALKSALIYCKDCSHSWKDCVREHIYKNNYNENKYLSVYEFDTRRGTEYYLYQYIDKENPITKELVRSGLNGSKNDLASQYRVKASKEQLDSILGDYKLIG